MTAALLISPVILEASVWKPLYVNSARALPFLFV